MMTKPCFLFITLTVCGLSALFVRPVDGIDVALDCRCLRMSLAYISPRLLRRIEIIPPGPQCRQLQILVTLKDNKTHCVDPKARWLKVFLEAVMPERL
ncbi:hypothetical protein GJAV_G00025630 [Gymnothorax javanicus]|nr:hypothetical protein GJAV_G00025630 [Gymnothorax javanicus]